MINRIKLFFLRFVHLVRRIYWYVFKPIYRGSKIVLTYEQEVLLIRHNYGGDFWGFPGGKLNKNEEPEQAVKRELREELSMTADGVYYVGSFYRDDEYKKDTVYCFWSEVEDKTFTIDPVEIAEAKWFPKSHLPKLGPNAQKIYDCYLSYVRQN